MVTVESVKNSLRIDHSLDDEMLEQIIATAENYIICAVDSHLSEDDFKAYKQFDWAVSLLSQHWYINRQMSSVDAVPVTVLSLIQQLRGSVPYADH